MIPMLKKILEICLVLVYGLCNVQPSDFVCSLLRSDVSLGALIMTYSNPLLWATYEVILLHPSSTAKVGSPVGNRTRDLSVMSSSAITPEPGAITIKTFFIIFPEIFSGRFSRRQKVTEEIVDNFRFFSGNQTNLSGDTQHLQYWLQIANSNYLGVNFVGIFSFDHFFPPQLFMTVTWTLEDECRENPGKICFIFFLWGTAHTHVCDNVDFFIFHVRPSVFAVCLRFHMPLWVLNCDIHLICMWQWESKPGINPIEVISS